MTINIVVPKTIRESVQSGLSISTKQNTRKEKRFFASSSGFCARQTALNAINEEISKPSASMKFYAEIGNTVEALIITGLKNDERLLSSGVSLPDLDQNLGGIVDALIIDYHGTLTRFPCILEIKTAETIPSKPKLAHEAQAMVYSAYTGLPAKIVYMARCNLATWEGKLEMQEFPLPFSEKGLYTFMWQVVFARLCLNAETLPDKRYSLRQSHCTSVFCPFVDNCWKSFDFSRFKLNPIATYEYKDLQERADKLTEVLISPEQLAIRRKEWLRKIAQENPQAKTFLVNDFYANNGFEWMEDQFKKGWQWDE